MSSLVIAATAWPAGCATAGAPQSPSIDAPDVAVDAAPTPDAPASSPCDLQLARLATGFEGAADGWTHVVLDDAEPEAPGWPLDEWSHGTATSGPGSCHTGAKCWATRLTRNYTSCERAALVSPRMDLSACTGRDVTLTFWAWYDFWTGVVPGSSKTWFDGGILEYAVSGSSWTQLPPTPGYPGTTAINPSIGQAACVLPNSFHVHHKPGWVGASGGWNQISVALPSAALTSTFKLRFAFASGVSFESADPEINRIHTRPGWYVDDVAFTAR